MESSFTSELLNEIIVTTENEINTARNNVDQLNQTLQNSVHREDEFKTQHDRFIGWAEIFDECDFDVKKMIVSHLVNKVIVGNNYDISIELTLSMEQYLELSEQDIEVPA